MCTSLWGRLGGQWGQEGKCQSSVIVSNRSSIRLKRKGEFIGSRHKWLQVKWCLVSSCRAT